MILIVLFIIYDSWVYCNTNSDSLFQVFLGINWKLLSLLMIYIFGNGTKFYGSLILL